MPNFGDHCMAENRCIDFVASYFVGTVNRFKTILFRNDSKQIKCEYENGKKTTRKRRRNMPAALQDEQFSN